MERFAHMNPSINRRKFLRIAGGAALLPVVPAGILSAAGAKRWLSARQTLLLLPSSDLYPDLGKNYLAGVEAYRQIAQTHALQDMEFLIEDTGIGQGRMLRIAKDRITSENIRLISGIIDPTLNPGLVELCREKNVMLLANHAGANVDETGTGDPNIVQNSLYYWHASHAMGIWAAGHAGRRAVVASSFYESGYDAHRAFGLGFESAGGEIIRSVVSNKPGDVDDRRLPVETIRKLQPDVVFAAYTGREAVEFIKAFTRAGLAGKTKLITSGFMVDEPFLAKAGPGACGILSCHTWAPGLDNAANRALNRHFRKRLGRAPDVFGVIGFETALLLDQIRRNGRIPDAGISGPRGVLQHQSGSERPLYLREVKQVNGKPENVVVAELSHSATGSGPIVLNDAAARSGWLNTYLCV